MGFFGSKVRRLIVPMLIVGTIFALARSHISGVNVAAPVVWHTLRIVPVAHYWFLEAIFIIFLVVAGLDHLKALQSVKRWVLVWVVALGLYAALLPRYFGVEGAAFLLPYFLVGLAIARFAPNGWSRKVTFALIVVVAIIIAYHLSSDGGWDEESSPRAAVLSCALCALLFRWHPQVQWLAWIGRSSFAIYLLHVFFSAGARITLAKAVLGLDAVWLQFSIGLAIGVLGPMLAERLLLRWQPWGAWVIGERPAKRLEHP